MTPSPLPTGFSLRLGESAARPLNSRSIDLEGKASASDGLKNRTAGRQPRVILLRAGASKRVARNQLVAIVDDADGLITAQAAAIGKADLLAQVNREISDIKEMADETLRVHAAFLIAKSAQPGMPAVLLPYGLTPAKATLFSQRYATYLGLINLPDERVQQEGTYVQLLDAQFDAADLRLDLIMDKLMRQFRETQPALYLNYKEARVINDAAAGVGSGGSGGSIGGGGGSSSSSGTSSSSGEPSSSGGSSSSSL